ncbi:helix-turn-helix domain-containing protein [Planococcus lenghuensis]|uniref:Helix-turn-helix domain-containing protein n=1 Tax=Planococcus lenghuensis TaxID=2213202 RepID=A0A1Q2L469_9BACL|nr:helix-turn-helix domain-containing protein [Planococcus lenghuensis]AQQ55255.1 hypothetical protein B0X71_18915 [Planococcus lenghuensis]
MTNFESLIQNLFKEEIEIFLVTKKEHKTLKKKRYLTMKETAAETGIDSYVLRRLTYERAMPHRKVGNRLIFDLNEIQDAIQSYKENHWSDSEGVWDVKAVLRELKDNEIKKEAPLMIDEVIRSIIQEELEKIGEELRHKSVKERDSYLGRTVLTLREAAEHFRVSYGTINLLIKEDGMPHLKINSRRLIVLEEAEEFLWRETAKSYSNDGNIYWQRILQKIDAAESKRVSAYEKALNRLENYPD